MARKNSETVPANTVTDILVSSESVETLANRYVLFQNALDKGGAVKKWEWARDVSAMLDSTADKSARTEASEKLGQLIGEGLGRSAYSGSWVRQHCSAYKKFENGMNTPEDYRAFLAAVNGNAGPSKQPKEKTEKVEKTDAEVLADYLKDITSAIKRAVAAGISHTEIAAAVKEGLSS